MAQDSSALYDRCASCRPDPFDSVEASYHLLRDLQGRQVHLDLRRLAQKVVRLDLRRLLRRVDLLVRQVRLDLRRLAQKVVLHHLRLALLEKVVRHRLLLLLLLRGQMPLARLLLLELLQSCRQLDCYRCCHR